MSSTSKRGTCVGVPRDHPDYSRLYREMNRDRVNKYSREYSKNNRDKRKIWEYSWREKNPSKVKEMNKRGGSKWASLNKGTKNFINNKRRKAIKAATPIWANMEKIKEFYLLAAQLTEETGVAHEVDHIYPIQGENVCGLHVENNLQILTQFENRSKGNSSTDWL